KNEQMAGAEGAGKNDQHDPENVGNDDQGEDSQSKGESREESEADRIQEGECVDDKNQPESLLDGEISAWRVRHNPHACNNLEEPGQHPLPQVLCRIRCHRQACHARERGVNDEAGAVSRGYFTTGTSTLFPPFIADSCAHIPAMVQLAALRASTADSLSSTIALMNSCARCGCDPPWPAPWMNEVCSC